MSDLNEAERAQRGQNAQRALDEFLNPAFNAVVSLYSERLEAIAAKEPWEAGKITALANAVRIAKEVHGQIATLVFDGQAASNGLIRAEKIERLTPAKRRFLNIAPY